MRRLLFLVAFALVAIAPCAAATQWSPAMVGVGGHGFDWSIGTWTCTNSIPSPIGGPATTYWIISQTGVANVLSFHTKGANFDSTGYLSYDTKTKTWWNPVAYTNGDYSAESSQGSGQKMVFVGPYFTAANKFASSQIRDSVTFVSATKITDVGATQTGGAWKTSWNLSCTRS
jgi:hypothetical protein